MQVVLVSASAEASDGVDDIKLWLRTGPPYKSNVAVQRQLLEIGASDRSHFSTELRRGRHQYLEDHYNGSAISHAASLRLASIL